MRAAHSSATSVPQYWLASPVATTLSVTHVGALRESNLHASSPHERAPLAPRHRSAVRRIGGLADWRRRLIDSPRSSSRSRIPADRFSAIPASTQVTAPEWPLVLTRAPVRRGAFLMRSAPFGTETAARSHPPATALATTPATTNTTPTNCHRTPLTSTRFVFATARARHSAAASRAV